VDANFYTTLSGVGSEVNSLLLMCRSAAF